MNEAEVFILRGEGPGLLVRRQQSAGPPVLYVHGATFPSALSAAWRFNGRSWMDDWNAHGFDAWAFDFAGYGGSDRYADEDDGGHPPGRAEQCALQLARVVEHMLETTGRSQLSIVAHSWGTMAATLYAVRHPECIARLCLFGPVLQRQGTPSLSPVPEWRLVSIEQQLARFVADVPAGHPPVLIEPELCEWGPAYLATDRDAASRTPPAVKIPNGPEADIRDAWSGKLAWRPQDVRCPLLCVRGEWDSIITDQDATWLLSQAPACKDVKIRKGTHLMHLEHSRDELFAAVAQFLESGR